MSEQPGPASEAETTEEELRAAYEQQIKQIRVDQILLENVVTLLNLGMRRTGLGAGTEDERDPAQVRLAIESVRAVLPLLEQAAPQHLRQVRDALSQLQLAFVRIGGTPEAPSSEEGKAAEAAGKAAEAAPSEAGAAPSEGEESGDPSGPAPTGEPQAPGSGEPGPAQRSGRLWVPGQ